LAAAASTDQHLIPQDEAAIDAFTRSRTAVIHLDARPIFIQELLAGAHKQLADVNGELLAERCLRMAVIALQEWQEPLAPPRWNVGQLQNKFSAAAADVLSEPLIWPLLVRENQDQVLSRCLDSSTGALFTNAPGRLLGRAERLYVKGLLVEPQRSNVDERLKAEDPWRLLGAGVRFEYVAEGIVQKLEDGSFNVAGEGVNLLRASRDYLANVDGSLQRQIGMNLSYAASWNTYAAINEIDTIANDPQAWPTAFLSGLVVGGLVGKWSPLTHAPTARAAMRIALSDREDKFAEDVITSLTPDRTETLVSPGLISELRTMLDGCGSLGVSR
jgi:hypothetical protein